jgi:transposase InsO family protein
LDVIEVLSELFITRGLPKHIRSDNGPEFTSRAIRQWLTNLEVGPLFIELGSPWENGYNESFRCVNVATGWMKIKSAIPVEKIYPPLEQIR